MKTLHYVFYFTLVVCVHPQRIGLGKNVTDPTKFPFYAMFLMKLGGLTGTCGGSLIHPQWILTAGHCIPVNKSDYPEFIKSNQMIYMGSVYRPNVTSPDQQRKVIEIHVHPDYVDKEDPNGPDNLTLYNDIALVKVNKPFQLSKRVQVIKLSTSFKKYNYVITIGIGSTSYDDDNKQSAIVKYAIMPIMKQRWYPYNVSTQFYTQIRLKPPLNLATGYALSGDSGGPSICLKNESKQFLQIGVLSQGVMSKPLNTIINIIERVDYFINFIQQHLPKDKYTKYLEKPRKWGKFRRGRNGTRLSCRCSIIYVFLPILVIIIVHVLYWLEK